MKMKVIDREGEEADSYYTRYKVVELTSVTDADLEKVLNEWSEKGWSLDTIQFAMRDSSKRPAMAFVLFTQSARSPVSDVGSEDTEEEDE